MDKLAQMIGLGAQTLRNKTNPNSEDAQLSLRQALAMMLHANDYQLLDSMAAICNRKVVQLDTANSPSCLVQLLLVCQAEHGDVARALADGLRDGQLTARERSDVAREIIEARDALDVLAQKVISGAN